MTRQENVGDRAAFPEGGFRILRVFEQKIREAVLLDRCLIPNDAGYKADGGIDQDLRGDFAPG